MRVFVAIVIGGLVLMAASSAGAEIPPLLGEIRADTIQTLFGYEIVPVGDQNDDGKDDILIWDYRWSAFIYYGADPLDTLYDIRFDNIGGRNSNIGDINGDSFDDLALSGRELYGWKLNVYYGGPTIDSSRDLWFGDDSLEAWGFAVHGNDFDGNGLDDVVAWTVVTQDAMLLFDLGSDSDTIPDLLVHPIYSEGFLPIFGERVVAGDFNGDGATDVAASLRFGSTQKIIGTVHLYWGGAVFDTLPDLILTREEPFSTHKDFYGGLLENLGDINGDGYEDLYVASSGSEDSLANIFFGGPLMDSIPDLVIPQFASKVRLAGDLNSDGYNDIITGRSGLPNSGHIKIYYGGPEIDNLPDIVMYNRDVPGYQEHFAMDCAGIGDINGDGIDDFAFSAVDLYRYGVVYIHSGPGSGTDIEISHDPEVPDEFELSTNYPNPFNASTKIEFAIPYTSRTTLTICNILGETVCTLVEEALSPGSYSITWNGRDEAGISVASGVYIYRLSSDSYSESRKMVLVK